jgi:hypothetical protein
LLKKGEVMANKGGVKPKLLKANTTTTKPPKKTKTKEPK